MIDYLLDDSKNSKRKRRRSVIDLNLLQGLHPQGIARLEAVLDQFQRETESERKKEGPPLLGLGHHQEVEEDIRKSQRMGETLDAKLQKREEQSLRLGTQRRNLKTLKVPRN